MFFFVVLVFNYVGFVLERIIFLYGEVDGFFLIKNLGYRKFFLDYYVYNLLIFFGYVFLERNYIIKLDKMVSKDMRGI